MWFADHLARLVDRLNGSVADPHLNFELIRDLYGKTSTPKALAIATGAAVLITSVAAYLGSDREFLTLAVLFVFVGLARSRAAFWFHRAEHDIHDLEAIRTWEYIAMFGAWSFGALVGITGAYAILQHPGTSLELVVACCVIGYLAGISSRNASRPLVTIGQITATCLPFMAALIWRADLAHITLAVLIAVLYVGAIVVAQSVFENRIARHEAFRDVQTLAHRDTLTHLWNRTAFLQLLEDYFASGQPLRVSLIAVDLDRFKDINDTFGHPVGDDVLKEAAERISESIGDEDQVARVGGDEFLVALLGDRADRASEVADAILRRFQAPFRTDTARSKCGASIGFAKASPGSSLEDLLRDADLALYEAKRRGRGQSVRFTKQMAREYQRRSALENDLDLALGSGQFELAFQPIVDSSTGRIICCEALLRWNHPTLGVIPPDQFIAIAESKGLIVAIGSWVLETACIEAMRWPKDVHVAVNLSPVQFRRSREILAVVNNALAKSGLSPDRLELEITESVLINNDDVTRRILDDLREKGINISLDDFGTGFASIAYLNDFPISKIKIDKKFSQEASKSYRTSAIVRGITQIANELEMECIAEGVETLSQLDFLQRLGINVVQGYLFSGPVHAAEILEVLQRPLSPGSVRPMPPRQIAS